MALRDKIDMLKRIEIQVINAYPNPTDEQRVMMAQSILNAMIDEGTPIDDVVLQADIPEFLGCTINWAEGVANDYVIKITYGDYSVVQDTTSGNVPVEFGAVDYAADVAADKAWLTLSIILGANSDENSVIYNLSFPSSGPNGSVISWDAAANSAVSNTGVVTRPTAGSGNASGAIVATISKSTESDTDTFSITVLEEVSTQDEADVAADKAWLTAARILNGNPNLLEITGDLAFPSVGFNGSTITWDCSANSAISDSGVVTRPANGFGDSSGDIVATITKGSASDTKTFSTTVLEAEAVVIPGDPFITTWQTDATGTVTSGTYQVKLPLNSTGTYNFTVDWGDGTTDLITSYNQGETTHTYGAIGSYDITIDGVCEGWGFWDNGEDNSKLTGIKQWGNVKLHNNGNQIRNCNNISSYTATDTLDISNITNMGYMFGGATLPTGFDISTWNTSSVTKMDSMFSGVTLPSGFDISGWNTSLVTNMNSMFNTATLPTGFDISTWNTSSVTNMGGMFGSITLPSGFDISTWDTSSVIYMDGMFSSAILPDPFDLSGWCVSNIPTEPLYFGTFNGTTQLKPVWGTCPVPEFITTWQTNPTGTLYTATDSDSIQIPLAHDGNYNFTVDWGDGTSDTITSWEQAVHQYSVSGIYDVTISGTCEGFGFSLMNSDNSKLLDVKQWGGVKFNNGRSYFGEPMGDLYGQHFVRCNNLQGFSATDSINLDGITNLSMCFRDAPIFNGDISSWNVSNVTDMKFMFYNAAAFNQPIGGWNISSVTNMMNMFGNAAAFNQDIGGWDISSVTGLNMSSMFDGAAAFNQDLSGWNTSNLTTMYSMFCRAAAFNGDISTWDVSNVTDMRNMFLEAAAFNQDISGWNTSNVEQASNMFQDATVFNGDISTWDVSNVVGMTYMFDGAAAFNQDLSGWNVNKVLTAPNSFSTRSALVPEHIPLWGQSWPTPVSTGDLYNSSDSFIMRIKTDNARTYNSTPLPDNYDYRYILPPGYGTFNYIVDWGDGTPTERYNVSDWVMHTYSVIGEYDIKITGQFPHMNNYWSLSLDTNKIIDVKQWGTNQWGSMYFMFRDCRQLYSLSASDSPNLSNVTDMYGVFSGATAFNGDISSWNVSNVTNMRSMFYTAAAFNQPIGGWNTLNVTDMLHMFDGATAFNQPIGGWNTSGVTSMMNMFKNATAFNQDLSGWNTSSVTDMYGVFSGATVFNGDISTWDVSNVTNMLQMFYAAAAFNQDIGGWNTSNLMRIASMFQNATAFNQDIGGWDISNASYMNNMFAGVTLSTTNYDALLNGWSTLDAGETRIPAGQNFSGGNSKYSSAGEAARNTLINTYGWTISDGGLEL